MELVNAIWSALAAGGGTLALTFIVLLALGIMALTVFYLGSAVVVLERFARVVRRPRSALAFAALASVLGASMWMRVWQPESQTLTWLDWFPRYAVLVVVFALISAVGMAIAWAALRFLRPALLGTVALCLLGAALGLFAGSTSRVSYALAPAGTAAALALACWWWQRRASSRSQSPAQSQAGEELWRQLTWLTLAMLPGVALAAVSPEPRPDLAMIGTSLVALFFIAVLLGLLPLAAAGLLDMRHSLEWFIAVRYLVAKRRQVFISAITAICVVGIAAGVWLIIVVLSVMNGFEKTWRDEIVGNRAHFTVHSGFGSFENYAGVLDLVRGVPGVTGASPYLDAEGMVRGGDGDIYSVRLRGIDPSTIGGVTDLPDDIIAGSLDALLRRGATAEGAIAAGNGSNGNGLAPDPGIVIGNQLAVAMDVEPGDSLLLISPYGGAPTPLGPAPRLKRFQVVGVFESSFFQYDEVFTYVNLATAQDFRRAGDVVDGIEARTTDFYRSQRVADEVRVQLEYPFFTRDWKEFFPAFFQALKTERVMMFVLLTMIMVVAAFVIVATLIMMIMEKSGDIAILKAMGAQDDSIERIFAIEGTLIGLAGTALGVVAGIAVTGQLGWIQEMVEVVTGIDTLPASIYQFSTLPSETDPVQIGIVALIAMVLSLGATLLPSRQGARLDPAEALRYE